MSYLECEVTVLHFLLLAFPEDVHARVFILEGYYSALVLA